LQQRLQSYGLADEAIKGVSTICLAIAQGEFDLPSTDLEKILGREPKSIRDFLKAAYQL